MRKFTLSILFILAFFTFTHSAFASTSFSGTITGDVTWTPDQGPYLVDILEIPQGSSLTILPGTVVKLGQPGCNCYSNIFVSGRLILGALGTTTRAVITSINDDIGGDTNSTTTPPVAGDWRQITVNPTGQLEVYNADIRYGGNAYAPYIYFNLDNVRQVNNSGTVIMDNADIGYGYRYNYAQPYIGTTTIRNSFIHDTDTALTFTRGSATVEGNTFATVTAAIQYTPQYTTFTHSDNHGTSGITLPDTITGNVTLTPDTLPYVFGATNVPTGSSLSVLPGAILKIYPGGYGLYVSGALTIGSSTPALPVTITSYNDDTVGGDTNGDGAYTTAHAGDWGGVIMNPGASSTIINTEVRFGGYPRVINYTVTQNPLIANYGGVLTLTDTTISDSGYYGILSSGGTTTVTDSIVASSTYGAYVNGGTLRINNSSIHDNTSYGVYNATTKTIDATNNWWGSVEGPTLPIFFTGAGDRISLYVDYAPYLTTEPGITPVCVTECYSNVLLLPGIMGSTLYRYNPLTGASTKVWEPSLGSTGTEQVEQLHMNPELATSNNADVYAKEILTEDWAGSNYYQTLSESLNAISGPGKSINAWKGIPYDWRLAPETIIANGKRDGDYISYLQSTSTPYIIQELKRLASTSKTGKVTIVAHSYGGLVTKSLVDALGTTTAQTLIDDIVFVAVPQVGTPQAIAGMLYGKNQDLGYGYAVTEEEAQSFAETLPMAYNLLPSPGYFRDVHEQVMTLPIGDKFALLHAKYGKVIGNWDEMHSFLTSASDRTLLTDLNVASGIPPQLNLTAHHRARTTHDTLDVWTPPTGITMTQIAGWGIPKTVKGVTFDGVPNANCTEIDIVCQDTRSWSLVPGYDTTIDGDGTVVTPSALWTSTTTGAVNYWVNLRNYGASGFFNSTINREHGDILEVPQLISFITDRITKSIKPLADYTYLSTEVPEDTSPRLRYSLHSPLTLNLYDDQGRHTGVSTTTGQIEEQIPGTYFSQMGEVKYLFTDASTTSHIIMNGYATGTFTFITEELRGDTLIASTTWKDMPVTPDTLVTLTTPSDITTLSPLMIDKNSDGIVDYAIASKLNDVVTLPKPQLTVTANNQTLTLGGAIPTLTATITGFVNADTASTSVSGSPLCTSTATSISPVGTYPITCTLGTLTSSNYDISTFIAGTLTITYRFDGFLQPINDTTYNPTQSLSVFKGGSTVPVKFQLKNSNGTPLQSTVEPVWLSPQQLSPLSSSVSELSYTDPATSGATFRYDAPAQQYIYNWSTKGLTAGYWYRLFARLDDGTMRSVVVGVR